MTYRKKIGERPRAEMRICIAGQCVIIVFTPMVPTHILHMRILQNKHQRLDGPLILPTALPLAELVCLEGF